MFTNTNFSRLALTHDSSLPAWGPYSKIMAGVAHVCDTRRGGSFNLSVFPSVYRGRMQLPTETAESNFHPWYAAGDLSLYTYRFELEWKDRVYCDVSYIRLADDAILVEMDTVNATDRIQQIGFHYLASMQYPIVGGHFQHNVRPTCEGAFTVRDGVHYDSLRLAEIAPSEHLTYDGKFRCEVCGDGMTDGRALGGRFGKNAGDTVTYTLDCPPGPHRKLTVRARGKATFILSGAASGEMEIDSRDFALYTIPIGDAGGKLTLTLTCTGGEGATIDAITASDEPVVYVPDEPVFVPKLTEADGHLTLDYGEAGAYSIRYAGKDHFVREIFSSDWEKIMTKYVMNHVSTAVRGDGEAHFTDLYARPFFLAPQSREKTYALVTRGDGTAAAESVLARYAATDLAALADAAHAAHPTEDRDEFALSQRLMNATLLTNIVYPVYVQGQYIRHFTPGKWWDSLYTWDSGFIALGLSALDCDRALDTLNCYLTEEGNDHAAFIHHGSPVPVQAYVYKTLFDRTQNREYLASFYPRMRQYYEFLLGRVEGSSTRRMQSGLLNTFDYFYNSGGWDDYPPQAEVHRRKIARTTCPAVTSVHAIVFARILRHASVILGLGEEARYEQDIADLGGALQKYAWDAEAGYFSYVTHGADGIPDGVLRDENGVNFNMGLDGAEALLAGITTPEQEKILADAVMDPTRMWTDCGISTVDRRAPYYRVDGYWNGAVWMPHQWFMFLAMLGVSRAADAVKIAETALETWRRETGETYNCYEHFILTSGRGGGWHHFGALSAPVVLWYHALLVPGTVTLPPDAWVLSQSFGEDFRHAEIAVDVTPSSRSDVTVLIAMADGTYTVSVDGREVEAEVYRRALALRIPTGRTCTVRIVPAR